MVGTFEFAKDKKEEGLLWSARKQALWSMLSVRKEGTELWSTDVAVPLSRLADIIVRSSCPRFGELSNLIAEISKRKEKHLGILVAIIGHLQDSNFHEAIMVNQKKNTVEFAAVEKAVHDVVDRALEWRELAL